MNTFAAANLDCDEAVVRPAAWRCAMIVLTPVQMSGLWQTEGDTRKASLLVRAWARRIVSPVQVARPAL